METEALQSCALFRGLSQAAVQRALALLDARPALYEKGEYLVAPGARLTRFALVLRGEIQVMTDDLSGHHMIMAGVSRGETFGESLCYLQIEDAPVYVRAATQAEVLWMRTGALKPGAHAGDDLSCALLDRFTSMLARRTLSMNDRIQILSKGSLREKLMTYFTQCAARAGKATFVIPFDRADLAAYLGVNRSALSRALSQMKDEGLIEFEKNRFTVMPDR